MIISTVAMVLIWVVLAIGAVLFAIWMIRWQFRTADARLERWAQAQSLRVVDKQSANPAGTGPIYGRGHNTQVVYRVIVEDRDGARRAALIKIGSPQRGVLAADFSVEWEQSSK